jgi:hypothetical protein
VRQTHSLRCCYKRNPFGKIQSPIFTEDVGYETVDRGIVRISYIEIVSLVNFRCHMWISYGLPAVTKVGPNSLQFLRP